MITGAFIGAFVLLAAATAVLVTAVINAERQNEHVTFTASNQPGVLIWQCHACGAIGVVNADTLDGGGFNHDRSCLART